MTIPAVPSSLENLVVVKKYLDQLALFLGSGGTEVDPIFLSQKGVANGVATLNGSSRVPSAQLGSGTADSTTFLRGDGSWIVISTPTNVWNQGGNTFGALGVFGTNDAFDVAFRAGGTERMRLLNSANILQGNGGFTVRGGAGASNGLTLTSTSHATKGKIFFASDSAFDESSSRWGFGNSSPSVQWDFFQAAPSLIDGHLKVRTSVGTFFEIDLQNSRVDLSVPGELTPKLRFEPGAIYLGNGGVFPPTIKISSFDSRVIIDDNASGLTPAGIDIVHYGGSFGSTASTLVTRTARGTVSSPTPIINNTPILLITTTGWDTSGFFLAGCQISVDGAETWTPTAHGCRITFNNAPLGSTTLRQNFIIQPDGAIQIGPSGGLGGYVSFPTRSSDPTAVSLFGQLYSKIISGKSQLFFRSDDSTVHQITPPAFSASSQIVENAGPFNPVPVEAVITGMTITPAAGTYMVWYVGELQGTIAGATIQLDIFLDGVQVAAASKTVTVDSNGGVFAQYQTVSMMARVIVNGSQAIDARALDGAGSGQALINNQLMIAKTS